MQRALLATLLLGVAAGLLGTWIVLRRLAFFAHAVGSATFPGLVVAGPWGGAPPLAALAAGLGLARLLARPTRCGAGCSASATATSGAPPPSRSPPSSRPPRSLAPGLPPASTPRAHARSAC